MSMNGFVAPVAPPAFHHVPSSGLLFPARCSLALHPRPGDRSPGSLCSPLRFRLAVTGSNAIMRCVPDRYANLLLVWYLFCSFSCCCVCVIYGIVLFLLFNSLDFNLLIFSIYLRRFPHRVSWRRRSRDLIHQMDPLSKWRSPPGCINVVCA